MLAVSLSLILKLPERKERRNLRNLFTPSAIAARLWSVPLQDQENEGKEVSRVKGKKVMLKLHRALLVLDKCCNTLVPSVNSSKVHLGTFC